jgi:glycosyltransferase involved in cell wall biosynthesis
MTTATVMTSRARDSPLRVAIDARVPAGQWGGIQQMVEGLARGLSELQGDEEYFFIGYADSASWLDPLLSGRCRKIEVERTFARSRRRRAYDALVARAPVAARAIGSIGGLFGRLATPIARSDGLLESLDVDVVHFVTPQAYLTDVPSVYQVMDLLHEHLPEFFSSLHRRYRDVAYRAFAKQATMLSTMADWTRNDIAARLTIHASRIAVVPLPPAVTPETVPVPQPPVAVIPERFVLYPAQTWPHKNHLALLEAIARLRESGSPVPLVCTGRMTDHYVALRRRIEELRVGDLVTFLGYVDQPQLAWLYRHASAMVFPTRFEGWGIPVVEAQSWGLPVACSALPVLDEAGGGAALPFDPSDVAAIATAIRQVVDDETLRERLIAAGHRRVEALTWPNAARTFRAIYRKAAGRELAHGDYELLAPPTMAP